MSRSNPNEELTNPCKHWFQWNGDTGGFKSYDKETKKNISIPLPFRFLYLDSLITITGYNEPEGIGYYSNEVRNIKDVMTVRSKNGIEMTGNWEQIKEKMGAKGADYCQSVYIAFYEGKTLVLGNIKMKGAALGPWFDFCKVHNVLDIGISVKEMKEGKKGKVVYQMPVFSTLDIKPETNQLAIEIDKPLQEYLKAYLAKNSPAAEPVKSESKSDIKTETKVEEKPKIDPLPASFDIEDATIVSSSESDEEPF